LIHAEGGFESLAREAEIAEAISRDNFSGCTISDKTLVGGAFFKQAPFTQAFLT